MVINVHGRIIDMNKTDAFVTFDDGTTMDIGVSHLPPHSKVGDTVNIELNTTKMTNDKFNNIF